MKRQSLVICVPAVIVALVGGCASQPSSTPANTDTAGNTPSQTRVVCEQSTGSMITRSCHSAPVDSVSAETSRQQGATSARQMLNRNGINTTGSN